MHLPLRSFLLGAFVTSVLTSPIVPGFIQGDDVAVVVEERGLWRRNNPPEPQPGSDAGGKSALNMQDMRKRVEYLRCLQYWVSDVSTRHSQDPKVSLSCRVVS